MKKLLKHLLGVFAGKKIFQPVFQGFYHVGLTGMNIGGSSDLQKNGELFALKYMKNHQKNKPVIFDVGSNIGNYIAVLVKIFDEVEIHSFEPLKINFERLNERFEHNSAVKLNHFGLGDKKVDIPIYFNPKQGALASVYDRQLSHHNLHLSDSETIKIETLDHYCKEHKITHIDYLKLDIEGHELAALNGSSKMLEQNRIKFIQFEFGGTNIDSKTYFQDFWYLLSPKYSIYRILKDGLKEIKAYRESNEIFGYTNYLAELK